MVLDATTKDPKRFGISGMNPMPDFVYIVPLGQNKLGIEDCHPKLTFKDEWEYDIIRIPIYVSMDSSNTNDAYKFLNRFFSAMTFRGPQDAIRGNNQKKWHQDDAKIAIGAYGSGQKFLGKDASAYQKEIQLNKNGFFLRGHYYIETICYYAFLLLNDKFPFK